MSGSSLQQNKQNCGPGLWECTFCEEIGPFTLCLSPSSCWNPDDSLEFPYQPWALYLLNSSIGKKNKWLTCLSHCWSDFLIYATKSIPKSLGSEVESFGSNSPPLLRIGPFSWGKFLGFRHGPSLLCPQKQTHHALSPPKTPPFPHFIWQYCQYYQSIDIYLFFNKYLSVLVFLPGSTRLYFFLTLTPAARIKLCKQ